jgi:hypothetical protein
MSESDSSEHSAQSPGDITDPDAREIVSGTSREKLQGWVPDLAGQQDLLAALEQAFDYRGDVTITRKDGTRIEGYIFDRRPAATLADSIVRIFPKDSHQKL